MLTILTAVVVTHVETSPFVVAETVRRRGIGRLVFVDSASVRRTRRLFHQEATSRLGLKSMLDFPASLRIGFIAVVGAAAIGCSAPPPSGLTAANPVG